MLITYIGAYLVFVILVSIAVSLVLMRMRIADPRRAAAIIAAVLLVPLMAGYLYITYLGSIPETVVPDLRGLPLEKAFAQLEGLRLRGIFSGTVFDMKYPEGSVVKQRPEAGRRVKEGRVIRLVTSSGKRKVLVPNLLGRPAIQAEAVLAAKGLYLGESEEDFMPELNPGIILVQNPLPGEEVSTGSYVKITVSTTLEPVVSGEAASEEGEEGGFKFWW